MPPEIELTETAPGYWEFLRRLRGFRYKRQQKASPEGSSAPKRKRGWDARREAFFDSLAGETIKPTPEPWWTGWTGVALVCGPIIALFTIADIWMGVAFIGLGAALVSMNLLTGVALQALTDPQQ